MRNLEKEQLKTWAGLSTVFGVAGESVTAGSNSSKYGDGAAFVVVMTEDM